MKETTNTSVGDCSVEHQKMKQGNRHRHTTFVGIEINLDLSVHIFVFLSNLKTMDIAV